MIAGPGVYICNECVDLCNDVLRSDGDDPLESGERMSARENGMSDEQILEQLPRLLTVGVQTEASLQRLVNILRERRVTWARIGTALGITRQSAWERFSGDE
ncbi:hypothetical protein L3i22_038020 [Actinoplanes sp. L3-i22]|nr:hypothetical protein L3i22_038020 [Actinoplanes sp. L3-i22]